VANWLAHGLGALRQGGRHVRPGLLRASAAPEKASSGRLPQRRRPADIAVANYFSATVSVLINTTIAGAGSRLQSSSGRIRDRLRRAQHGDERRDHPLHATEPPTASSAVYRLDRVTRPDDQGDGGGGGMTDSDVASATYTILRQAHAFHLPAGIYTKVQGHDRHGDQRRDDPLHDRWKMPTASSPAWRAISHARTMIRDRRGRADTRQRGGERHTRCRRPRRPSTRRRIPAAAARPLSSATPNATIYTTDGSTPTAASARTASIWSSGRRRSGRLRSPGWARARGERARIR
jgi:hypothetical protein